MSLAMGKHDFERLTGGVWQFSDASLLIVEDKPSAL